MSAETVADVVAWMRGYAAGFNLYLRTGMTFRDWLLLCDRLEAAHKREINVLKSPAAPAPSGAIGDPAKLREALSDACYAMFNFLKTQNGGYEEMANALDKAKAALAAQPSAPNPTESEAKNGHA